MDLSKLSRLSETPEPGAVIPAATVDPASPPSAAAPPSATQPVPVSYSSSGPPPAAEAWFSLAIGAIVLLVWPTCLKFFFTGVGPSATDASGNTFTYPHSAFFLPDLGLTIFGIALILEGILLFIGKRGGIWIALLVTALSSVVNLIAVAVSYKLIGLQIVSLVAVVIGVYMCLVHWRVLHPAPSRR